MNSTLWIQTSCIYITSFSFPHDANVIPTNFDTRVIIILWVLQINQNKPGCLFPAYPTILFTLNRFLDIHYQHSVKGDATAVGKVVSKHSITVGLVHAIYLYISRYPLITIICELWISKSFKRAKHYHKKLRSVQLSFIIVDRGSSFSVEQLEMLWGPIVVIAGCLMTCLTFTQKIQEGSAILVLLVAAPCSLHALKRDYEQRRCCGLWYKLGQM